MQVCRNRRRPEAFFREVVGLAAPGSVMPELVEVLAAESLERFSISKPWAFGLTGSRAGTEGESGAFRPPATGRPGQNLPPLFAAFRNRLDSSVWTGCLTGWWRRSGR
jgi:hypothetical protein